MESCLNESILTLQKCRVSSAKDAGGWNIEGQKRRATRKKEEFEVGGVMAQIRAMENGHGEDVGRQRRFT